MTSSFSKRKYLLISLLIVTLYAGLPRIWSVNQGLPYHHFWDEPKTATGALNAFKTNEFLPKSTIVSVYGGGLRNPLVLLDFVYYYYLKIVPNNGVDFKTDIKTHLDGVYKTTSHSGFYYWNRAFVVCINVLGFWFLFEIGRIRGGYFMGFLAVLILGSIFQYYSESYVVKVDKPLSAWTLGVIYFTLRFNRNKNYRDLLWSFFFVGLAGATKYTGMLTIVLPLSLAFLYREQIGIITWKKGLKKLITLGGVTLGVFAILNPTTFIHPKRMYELISWIGWVYKTGQGHFSKEPGWEHFSYQAERLWSNFGSIPFILAMVFIIIGIAKILISKQKFNETNTGFLIIISFPIFYLVYITSIYTIAYHRNFSLMYPFLALLAAEFVYVTSGSILKLIKMEKWKTTINVLILLLLVLYFLPGIQRIYSRSRVLHLRKETRTKAIAEINLLQESNSKMFIGISRDLLYSPEDLRSLNADFGHFDISELDSAMIGFTQIVLPNYNSNLQVENFNAIKLTIDSLVNHNEIKRIKGSKLDVPLQLVDHSDPIINPEVIIISAASYPPPAMKKFQLALEYREAINIIDQIPDRVFTPIFKPGKYRISFQIRGDEALDEFPVFHMNVCGDSIATLTTSDLYEFRYIDFTINESKRCDIYFSMPNDLYLPEQGLDRNIQMTNIEIRKIDE